MRKLLLILLVLFSQPVVNCTSGNDQDQVLIHFKGPLKGSTIRHDKDGSFHVIHKGMEIAVQNCFVDTFVRNCSTKYMIEFFRNGGYLIVNEFDDGEIYIKAKMRLLGGGAVFCILASWAISFSGIVVAELAGEALDNFAEKAHRKREIFIRERDIALEKLHKDKVEDEIKCVIGPGIPIGPCPIPFPGTRLPYPKMPKEIIRQPMPIIIGPVIRV